MNVARRMRIQRWRRAWAFGSHPSVRAVARVDQRSMGTQSAAWQFVHGVEMMTRSSGLGFAVRGVVARMKGEPSRGAALVLAVLATACGDAVLPDEQLGDVDQTIVNGTVNNGDPAVVALTAGGYAFCTGTLIRPTVVLTAAHCLPPNLSDFGVFNYNQIDVFFGSQVGGGGEVVSAVSGWTHPGWNIDVFEDDIGLLRLSAAGPATPIPFATQTMTTADQGAPVRLVGFGITSDGANDSGRKRQGTTTIDDVYQFVFTMGLEPSGTCSGDSGGPTFMTRGGQEVVAGIHSRSDCISQAIDTRVDDYQSDINAFIGETPSGPQCFADGQCATGCGAADPDCPCAADGFCSDLCLDQSTDPDCQPSCGLDGVCNPECAAEQDPDCSPVEPPPTENDRWVAGDAENEDYDGVLLSSCAHGRSRAPHHGAFALLLAGLGWVIRRRR